MTISTCISETAIEALLHNGCKAVVSQNAGTEEVTESSLVASFFSALYMQLHAGQQLMQVSSLSIDDAINGEKDCLLSTG